MLAAGIIEPSYLVWSSPVVLVPQTNGGHRVCVDYRKLNSIMENDAYYLPNITEILESLDGLTVFSSIDLNSGYWQITIDPASKSKATFIMSSCLFHFNVMPFGLKNAPAKTQCLMETVLRELHGQCCLVYLDYIIIYSSSVIQHFSDL